LCLLLKLAHQGPGRLVTHDGEKISLGRHCDGHRWRGLLCAGLALREPDALQNNRASQLTALSSQAGDKRLASQPILLFKAKRHEPDWSHERLRAEVQCHFEKHDKSTRVVICAR
jgi:hypothetical protein